MLSLACLAFCAGRAGADDNFSINLSQNGFAARVGQGAGEDRLAGTLVVVYTTPQGASDTYRGRREGVVSRAWVVDMNKDATPEVVVSVEPAGSGRYGQVVVLTWRGGKLEAAFAGEMTDKQKEGYRGHDNYHIYEGVLHRQFPVYAPEDLNSAPSRGTRRLRYVFGADHWEDQAVNPPAKVPPSGSK